MDIVFILLYYVYFFYQWREVYQEKTLSALMLSVWLADDLTTEYEHDVE